MSTFENVPASSHAVKPSLNAEVLSNTLPWFAVQVRCHAEKNVSLMLEARGFEQYLPVYHEVTHWSDRTKELELPLFPGYVFCRIDVPRRRPVVTVPGVVSIVGFGGGFTPIPENEIFAIRSIVRSGLASGPWPYLEKGQRVRISAGALEGVEGILVRLKSDYRVVVSVSLLQRSVAVEIEQDWIQPAATHHPC